MWSSSLPTQLPRALPALAHETVVTEDGPPPYGRAGSRHQQVEPSLLLPAVPPLCNVEHGQPIFSDHAGKARGDARAD